MLRLRRILFRRIYSENKNIGQTLIKLISILLFSYVL